MRALEAPELWDEVLFESSHDMEIDESKVAKFRTIFYTDKERRGRRAKTVKIKFNQEEVTKRLKELKLAKSRVGFMLNRSDSYFRDVSRRKTLIPEHIDELNDILGGEYFKAVDE